MYTVYDDTYSKGYPNSRWLLTDNYYKPLQQCMVVGLHSYLWNNNHRINTIYWYTLNQLLGSNKDAELYKTETYNYSYMHGYGSHPGA